MNVRLHPEKGLNPRVTICIACGADVGVILLGSNELVYTCDKCGRNHLGGKPKRCPCGELHLFTKKRKVGDYEKIPLGLCKSCEEELEKHKSMVKEGGVYWRCTKCRNAGVILNNHELAKIVRDKLKIEPPAPCGVEFDGDCPACKKKEQEKQDGSFLSDT